MVVAQWFGPEKMDELIAAKTGQILIARVAVPHAGWPQDADPQQQGLAEASQRRSCRSLASLHPNGRLVWLNGSLSKASGHRRADALIKSGSDRRRAVYKIGRMERRAPAPNSTPIVTFSIDGRGSRGRGGPRAEP
jgi:ribosomal 50S subunit-recycling heat shock protein